jgi:SAM-dependent methyltransferase
MSVHRDRAEYWFVGDIRLPLRCCAVPDAIFAHPRLAAVYDAFDGDRADLDAYLRIADEFDARHVLDVGCGTGSLAILLAGSGRQVTGVDPAGASLAVAMSKPGAASVTWLHGDATTLPALSADIAMITGNVAQVFLDDDDWSATLHGIRDALRDGGHLVFETRRPERRAWEDWAVETGPVIRNIPGVGEVEQRMEVTRVALPYVSFRYTYTFASDGLEVRSDSTLRFRSRAGVEETLATNGFTTLDVREAPDRPGREYVFVAQPTHQR